MVWQLSRLECRAPKSATGGAEGAAGGAANASGCDYAWRAFRLRLRPSAEADEVRQKLLSMQSEYIIELGDAVVVTKCPEGDVRLNQLFQPVKAGAVSGMFWGTLIGLLLMMPLAGAAIGAASGAISGKLTDVGINDQFMNDVGQTLQSGNAALFLLIRKMTTDKVAAALQEGRRQGAAQLV